MYTFLTELVWHLQESTLSRHMQSNLPNHNWNKEKSKYATNLLKVSKPRQCTSNGRNIRRPRKYKFCPVRRCHAHVKRLDKHLTIVRGRTGTTQQLIIAQDDQNIVDEGLLAKYQAWVSSGDGGCKAERTVSRHATQLKHWRNWIKRTLAFDSYLVMWMLMTLWLNKRKPFGLIALRHHIVLL